MVEEKKNGYGRYGFHSCGTAWKTLNYSPSRKHGQFSITRFPIGYVCPKCKTVKLKEGYSLE